MMFQILRLSAHAVAVTLCLTAGFHTSTWAAPIQKQEVEYQNQNFKRWWGVDLNWRFDELAAKGIVAKYRLPYSGYIYPDNAGGTASVLSKYDRAFHRGSFRAAGHEHRDIMAHQEPSFRRGLFGRRRMGTAYWATPHWAGHCNGWTAAAIRHTEPQRSVVRNGVVFTPADIKGLLAELYVYADTEFLGGIDPAINPGTFHVIVANWIARGEHPIGMETTVGREVWNYPVYAYASSAKKRSDRRVEVKLNVGYVNSTDWEHNRAPKMYRYMHFHYMLDLNDQGNVAGGRYFRDSNRIDMLWVPLKPSRRDSNERRVNPFLSAKKILAMWRESAPEDVRKRWYNIDPTDEDRIPETMSRHKATKGLRRVTPWRQICKRNRSRGTKENGLITLVSTPSLPNSSPSKTVWFV